MSIIGNILQNKIDKNGLVQFSDTTATILDYDIMFNTVKVKFLNPNGEGFICRDNVQLANSLGGTTGSGIYPGQRCTISFMKNNIYNPVVVGLNTNYYDKKTNSDQGGFIISNINTKEPEKIKPMISDWIDEKNLDDHKYNDDSYDYTVTDASAETVTTINQLDKYGNEDQGITSLKTKSTVKLRENGDIDIFVGNNTGLKISVEDQKIYMYGLSLVFNGKEYEDFDCHCDTNKIGIKDITNVAKVNDIIKEIDDYVDELKKCIKITKGITGLSNSFIILESKILQYETLRDKYLDSKYGFNDLEKLYTSLVEYRHIFKKELDDAIASGLI